jgi:hypothetical protein
VSDRESSGCQSHNLSHSQRKVNKRDDEQKLRGKETVPGIGSGQPELAIAGYGLSVNRSGNKIHIRDGDEPLRPRDKYRQSYRKSDFTV